MVIHILCHVAYRFESQASGGSGGPRSLLMGATSEGAVWAPARSFEGKSEGRERLGGQERGQLQLYGAEAVAAADGQAGCGGFFSPFSIATTTLQ